MNDAFTCAFPALRRNQQKGSKPRCHLLTSGASQQVAERLTKLVALDEVVVRAEDNWFPKGFEMIHEAQLGTEGKSPISDHDTRKALRDWWLSVQSEKANTPNWDIASTCTIKGESGLLLIEAKAHDAELRNEERGKPLVGKEGQGVSTNSRRNHVRIGAVVQEASLTLSLSTGLPWALSRDWNYQMTNRFAWSCRLAEMGVPVVMAYLGFLNANEMAVGKQVPFATPDDWDRLVRAHSASLFPQSVWGQSISVAGTCFIPIIRSFEQPLAQTTP